MRKADQACGNCNARLDAGPGEIWCRAQPPVPVFMGMAQNMISINPNEQAQPIVIAHFPRMQKSGWCRAWEADKD